MRKDIRNPGKSHLHGRTANLDWESLRTVLAVRRARSLAGAARALDLTRREADIAVRSTLSPPEALVGRKLATLAYAVYAAPSLLKRGKTPELPALPWIGYDERLANVPAARWLKGAMPDLRARLRV